MFDVIIGASTALALAVGLLAAIWDIKTRTLPDVLNLIIVGIALLGQLPVWIYGSGLRNFAGLLVALLAGLLLFLIQLVRPDDFGGGDVKYGFALVLVVALREPIVGVCALLLPFVISGVFTAIGLLTKRLRRESHIPFGPFQWLGAVISLAGASWFRVLA